MAPKGIEHDRLKFREELPKDSIENLIVDGGAEKVKEAIAKWGYSLEDEKIVVPVLLFGHDGKLVGAKWQVLGGIKPKVVKAEQIWPEADKDVFLDIVINDMTIFSFYNKCRNVSGWLDSDTLSWSVFRKEGKSKVVIPASDYAGAGIQKFCLRLCILPISGDQASLTLAFVPHSKEEKIA